MKGPSEGVFVVLKLLLFFLGGEEAVSLVSEIRMLKGRENSATGFVENAKARPR